MFMNWDELLKHHLQELVRIDTTNPPGDEIKAARYIARVLEEANIEHEVVEPFPGRGSVVARLRGDGTLRPLLLLGHLDVVTANAADWKYHPFSAEEAHGAIWGRGTLDMKGLVATWLVLLLKLRSEGVNLKRDIIFAATADEESGGHHGLKWLVENRPDLVDCELALNEGGGNALKLGGKTFFTYQAGEKAGCPVSLVARGTAGHASIPSPDNPVLKLGAALHDLSIIQLPYHPTKTAEAFLSGLADGLGGSVATALRIALSTGQVPRVVNLAVKDPFHRAGLRAMLSNTAVPTMLTASQKRNVIPSEAVAKLDCRILPGQTSESLLAELRAVLPKDVEVVCEGSGLPTESEIDTPLASIIKQTMERHMPGVSTVPLLSPGATDARYLRPRGTIVYGFAPMLPGERVDLAHGVDERITLESLTFGLRLLEDVVRQAAQAV
jgi:acetylornithine deacetylase/succinyl-diaminopimelate desuccinylase-like protein